MEELRDHLINQAMSGGDPDGTAALARAAREIDEHLKQEARTARYDAQEERKQESFRGLERRIADLEKEVKGGKKKGGK
jgi:hypothetical protein